MMTNKTPKFKSRFHGVSGSRYTNSRNAAVAWLSIALVMVFVVTVVVVMTNG